MELDTSYDNISEVLLQRYEQKIIVHNGDNYTNKSLVVIGTDCIGSCKSNYQTITATTAPIIVIFEF